MVVFHYLWLAVRFRLQKMVEATLAGLFPKQYFSPSVDGSISSRMALNFFPSQACFQVQMSLQAALG